MDREDMDVVAKEVLDRMLGKECNLYRNIKTTDICQYCRWTKHLPLGKGPFAVLTGCPGPSTYSPIGGWMR